MMTQTPQSGAASNAHESADAAPDSGAKLSSRSTELWCAVAALFINALLAWFASRIELRVEAQGLDPRWWPTALALVGLVLATTLLVMASAGRNRHTLDSMTAKGIRALLLVGAVTVIFVLAWQSLGFVPSAVVYLFTLTWIFGERRWKVLTFYPLGLTAFIHLMFHTLLQVPL